jgi:hypothetical protein
MSERAHIQFRGQEENLVVSRGALVGPVVTI